MEIDEVLKLVLWPFGGTSVALVAMVGFLAHISTKRIINGELAEHKFQLESFKSESRKELQFVKDAGAREIEALRNQYTADIERIKAELQSEFLKHETYTTISKEIYQDLFSKRIDVYGKLLNLKKEIDRSVVDNADFLEIHDDDPSPFTNAVKQIAEASQENPMVLSNELAALSAELVETSTKVFANARVQSLYAEARHHGSDYVHEIVMEAQNDALRKMFEECSDVYERWFSQLNKDVSKIRSVLDLASDFLDNEILKNSTSGRAKSARR
jgi:vacuolar-type H+-ATPase subunit E/Vma4